MEGTNTFDKGLHRSNSPQMQPEGSYVDALNWIRNDSGRLINEEAEEIVKTLNGTYKFLGSCPVRDSFICFFQEGTSNSEIGVFDNATKSYRTVFNDSNAAVSYKLNFTNEIDAVARIVSTGDTIVYFVEKNNKPRRFNITQFEEQGYASGLYDTVEDWNLQLTFKMPYAEYTIERDGTLPTGTYSFAFRYATDENNKTTFNIPSRFINIASNVSFPYNSGGIYDDTVTGDLPQATSNQKIIMSLKNLDLNYPYIEPVVITYLGLTNVLSIKSLGLFENKDNLQITFSTDDQYLQDVSESALLELPVIASSAECIEQKDNILILSNITSKKYDVGFQKEVANNIKLLWEIEQKPVDTRRNITGVRASNGGLRWAYQNNYQTVDGVIRYYADIVGNSQQRPDESRDLNFQQSNVYADPLVLKGFQRGEVYSFSITPIYKDGSIGFSYHIPGNLWASGKPTNGISSWSSIEEYTPVYQLSDLNGPIRHHQMPDYDECGYIGDYDYINILKVKATNINFTAEQKANIQGYIIGYQPRNNDVNTRIIDNGFSRPYLQNEADNNKYINSIWTGSAVLKEKLSDSEYVWEPRWSTNRVYAMYHSPDSLLNREKIQAGYKIERVGYGNNLIIHAGNPEIDGGTLFDWYLTKGPDPYYVKMTLPICANNNEHDYDQSLFANMFFEFNEFVSNKGDAFSIQNALYVPAVGANNPTLIDGKITLKYSSEYIHLETADNTSSSHFYDSASYEDRKYFLSTQYFIDQLEGLTTEDTFRIFSPIDCRDFADDNTQRIGINLCRIINDSDQQYGKLENAEFTPGIVVLGDSNNLPTEAYPEGDVYISKYFFNMYDKLIGKNNEDVEGHSMMGIYVESKNNYALRHTEDGKVPFYPNYKYLVTPVENTTTPGMFVLDWYKVTTGYNKQYSSLSNLKLNFPKPLLFNEIDNYTNRSIYSNQSFESELVDQYRVFSANNFHDIPRHMGEIKDTFVFNNNFFHHTEYALWLSYFNPNTTQTTSQGEVVLGNAGVFRIPSKLILDIRGGYMGTMDKSGTNTPFGRVFLDHKQGKVFLFDGQAPVEISDLGLFSFFRDFVNTNDDYNMGYDWANKRLLLNNISKGTAISYYPKTQTWTSFHNFSPEAYFTTNGYSYAYGNNKFYNLDNTQGARKTSYITFVENTQPDAFKRFDRMEINTMSGGSEVAGSNYLISPGFVTEDNYKFLDRSFTSIHCWTDRQNSTELDLLYSHDYNQMSEYYNDKIPANYYRSSFHIELPADAVKNPYANIFDPANLDRDADFKSHLKSKFLYTKLSYKENNPLVLNYIKTYFKPTVA